MIETSAAYGISDPVVTAEAGLDYEHVSLRYDNVKGQQEGFVVPIIHDDKVEGAELFQVNLYDLIDPFQPLPPMPVPEPPPGPGRRKRDGLHPLDSARSTRFPCATVVIVDDDGESVASISTFFFYRQSIGCRKYHTMIFILTDVSDIFDMFHRNYGTSLTKFKYFIYLYVKASQLDAFCHRP